MYWIIYKMNIIKKLREKQGITQKALAEKMGIAQKTISEYETGKHIPSVELLPKLAKALNTNIETLVKGLVGIK